MGIKVNSGTQLLWLERACPAESVVFGLRHRKSLKRPLAGSCITLMIVDCYEKRLRSTPSTPS